MPCRPADRRAGGTAAGQRSPWAQHTHAMMFGTTARLAADGSFRPLFLAFLRGLARRSAPSHGLEAKGTFRTRGSFAATWRANPGGKDGPLWIALAAGRADSDSAADLSVRRPGLTKTATTPTTSRRAR